VLWDERDGLLNAQRIAQAVPQWRDADVWFCGPAGFGQALEQGLQALGLPAERLHRELFQMR
jgi:ferredoxin-NADP reductase